MSSLSQVISKRQW